MPDLHTPGPADTGGPPPARPVTFAARLRASLPTSPADILIYAAMAAALRLFLHFTLAAAVGLTAGAAAAGVVVFATLDYLAARYLPPATRPGRGGDDDAVSGDG
jgi:hypothetical protein